MAEQGEISREEELLIEEAPFRRNAFLLIDVMVEQRTQAPGDVSDALVDEILHSIFFLGRIHIPPFSPESIVGDELLGYLKRHFPESFHDWLWPLPKRSPFSCVLDMIVHLKGQKNETEIIDRLRELIRELELGQSRDLVSSTICVSHRIDDDDDEEDLWNEKCYGVSMSAPGCTRKIMIAVSCLCSWDSYVAGAVMTYFPTKKKNTDFDGTIKLPTGVRCKAFSLLDGSVKPPCISCGNLFGLTTREGEKDEWVYGNCAEVESLSKLFKTDRDVRERARPPTSPMYSDEKRHKVEKRVQDDLTNSLKQRGFSWNEHSYITLPV